MSDNHQSPDPWFIKDDHGYPIFRVTTTELAAHGLSGFVEEIHGWSCEVKKDPTGFEHYLQFYIKWDGCSHLNFGEKTENSSEETTNGYLHLCGALFWKHHIQLLTALYQWAQRIIPMPDHALAGKLPDAYPSDESLQSLRASHEKLWNAYRELRSRFGVSDMEPWP